jgi:hypothetical protein
MGTFANLWPWGLAAAGLLYLLKGSAPAGELFKQVLGFFGLGGLGAGAKTHAEHDMTTVAGRFACYDCLATWLAEHGQADVVATLDRDVAPRLFDRAAGS